MGIGPSSLHRRSSSRLSGYRNSRQRVLVWFHPIQKGMSSSETRLFPLLPYLPLHKKPLVSLMVVVEVMVGFCWGIFVPSSTSCLLFGEGMEV